MKVFEVKVGPENEGIRLDLFVPKEVPEVSRSQVAQLIKEGKVKVNNKKAKPSYRLKEGETIIVEIPPPPTLELEPQDLPFSIVYEDSDLAIVDKPRGMVVHPAQGNWDQTLVNALLYRIQGLSSINGEMRPGIVHRLDKDTSGLLIVAKNDRAHRHLAEQIKRHQVVRKYMALVHGRIKENQGQVAAPIGRNPRDRKKMAVIAGGREAVTNYRVIRRFHDFTLVECSLETGRTHQIRVHMAYLGHPVAGDALYGPRRKALDLKGQALHACLLSFKHPATEQIVTFTSPLPAYFEEVLAKLSEG